MKQMKDVALLLEKVSNTSSTKAKQQLLENGDKQEYSVTLRGVLYYCYNPFLMFGLSEKILNNTIPKTMTYAIANEHEVFDVLDTLAQSNINDELRTLAKRLLMSIEDEQVRNMVQGIMVKDLKLGVNVTTLNKVFGKDFIPTFEVQLAESYAKQKEGSLKNKEVWITTKLDGFRIVYDPIKNEFYTRKGQLYEGLDHLKDSCYKLSLRLMETAGLSELVMLDGELLHQPVEGLNSQELYALTSSTARKKGYHKDKEKLEFNVFDFIPVSEFQSGKTTMKYKARRNHMDKVFNLWKYVGIVPVYALYSGKFDEEVLMNLLKQVELEGGEGLMINLDATYKTKRTKDLLKVKTFKDADVLVLDVVEGTGKNEGSLGAVLVQFLYDGKPMTCEVGSGWYDSERSFYWRNPDKLIGKIIEIRFFEVTQNQKDKTQYSLRFPTFAHRIREDKDEKDITDVNL